jgi:hypothetical protein
VNSLILKYRTKLALKRGAALALDLRPAPRLTGQPSVTVFVTSLNNCYPLQLAIETLARYTNYENYRIVVLDMGSTDGSLEYLHAASERLPLTVRSVPQPRPQHEWYDEILATSSTDYWIAIHEDIFFLGRDWLRDMISFMECERDVYLLGGECYPPNYGMVEPEDQGVIDLEESLSTWIFCVRSSLRDHVRTSFAFYKVPGSIEKYGRLRCYDVGGKLLADMRALNLRYATMPRWFGLKWQHIGNLSYWLRLGKDPQYLDFKRHQIADAKRRAEKLTSRPGGGLEWSG